MENLHFFLYTSAIIHNKTEINRMFRDTTEQKEEKNVSYGPIVVLDVDETLILGHNEKGEPFDTFNHALIEALNKAGIKNVYLLTSYKLKLLKTQQERDEARQISRVQLIDHLLRNDITVKAVVSNHDLITQPGSSENSFLDNIPGNYFERVIKPQEMLILENPAINLNDPQCSYSELFRIQQKNEDILDRVQKRYPTGNIKSSLSDLLFTYLKREKIISDINPSTILFLDDKQHYLDSVSMIAKKHALPFDGLKVTSELGTKDYLAFLSNRGPDRVAYPTVVANSVALLQSSKSTAEKKLTGLLFTSRNKDMILTPINVVLKVLLRVQNDMIQHPDHHDCTGACNAMIHEMNKQIVKLNEIKGTVPEKEKKIIEACLVDMNTAFHKTKEISATLAAYFHMDIRDPHSAMGII